MSGPTAVEVIDYEIARLNGEVQANARYLADEFGRVAEIAASDWATKGKRMFWPGTTDNDHARLREAMAERNQLLDARKWILETGAGA